MKRDPTYIRVFAAIRRLATIALTTTLNLAAAPLAADDQADRSLRFPGAGGLETEGISFGEKSAATAATRGIAIINEKRLLTGDAVDAQFAQFAFTQAMPPDPSLRLLAAPADTLIAWSSRSCLLRRIGSDGSLRWQTTFGIDSNCYDPDPIFVGETILTITGRTGEPDVLHSIDLNGQRRWQVELAQSALALFHYAPDDLSYVVSSSTSGAYPTEGITARAYAGDGSLRWQWSSPSTQDWSGLAMQLKDDGRLHLIGDPGIVYLSTDGEVSTFDLPAGTSEAGHRVSFDGDAWYSVSRSFDNGSDGSVFRVTHIDPELGERWERFFAIPGTEGSFTRPPDILTAGNGDLVLAGSGTTTLVERIDRAGQLRFQRTYPSDGILNHRFLIETGDGLIALGIKQMSTDSTAHTGDPDVVEWLDRDGTLAGALLVPPWNGMPASPPAFTSNTDGLTDLLIPATADEPAHWLRISSTGTIERDSPLPTDFTSPMNAVLACGVQSTCIANTDDGGTRLKQFDPSTGASRWRLELASPPSVGDLPPVGVSLHPAADGEINVVESWGLRSGNNTSYQSISRIRPDGTIRFRHTIDNTGEANLDGLLIAVGNRGQAATRNSQGRLQLLRTDGSIATLSTDSPEPYAPAGLPLFGTIGNDDSLSYLAIGTTMTNQSGLALVRFDTPGGSTSTPLGDWGGWGIFSVQTDRHRLFRLPDGSDLVLLEQGPSAYNPDHGSIAVVRIDGNGQIAWSRRWQRTGEDNVQLVVRSDASVAMSSQRPDSTWVVRTLNGDGDLIQHREFPCRSHACRIDAVHFADSGLITGIGREDGDEPGYLLQQVDHADRIAYETAVDQPALNGAWYAPATSGQGFTFRVHPGADGATIFMPWFTFTREGDNQSNELRWFALQSTVPAGATQTDLTIHQASGGRFPDRIANLTAVGSARLRFASCDRAVLEYRFEPPHHDGAEGSIALQRLLPVISGCNDSDGPDQPQEAGMISGTWYDPGVPGQGLEIQHLQATGDASDVLFGAWYTFNPAPSDLPLDDQRWFTLQTGVTRPDGSVGAIIYQTLGGRFDAKATGNTFRVGEVELVPDACDRLNLHYRFDDNADAGAFRGLSGELALQRLGDCPAM